MRLLYDHCVSIVILVCDRYAINVSLMYY